MPPSTTPGSSIIARPEILTWPSPQSNRLATPNSPAIRFTRASRFVASWFAHLLRPVGLLAPRTDLTGETSHRGLLRPGFQRLGLNPRCWIWLQQWLDSFCWWDFQPTRMAASFAALDRC